MAKLVGNVSGATETISVIVQLRHRDIAKKTFFLKKVSFFKTTLPEY